MSVAGWFGVAEPSSAASCQRVFSSRRYLDNQVFVSLANGELVVYQREAGEAGSGTSKGTGGVKCSPKVVAGGWVVWAAPREGCW